MPGGEKVTGTEIMSNWEKKKITWECLSVLILPPFQLCSENCFAVEANQAFQIPLITKIQKNKHLSLI